LEPNVLRKINVTCAKWIIRKYLAPSIKNVKLYYMWVLVWYLNNWYHGWNGVENVSNVLMAWIMIHFKLYITKLQGFIGSYKFCAKFNFHIFIKKIHEFNAWLKDWYFTTTKRCPYTPSDFTGFWVNSLVIMNGDY
jgi:hypothetical protein